MKWNLTKYLLMALVGFLFSYVSSIFNEWRKTVNPFDWETFLTYMRLVIPFVVTVLFVGVLVDATAFGWEKTKKNIPAKLLSIKRWIQKERDGRFEKKLFADKNGIFLNIRAEKRFPFSSKIEIIVDYKENKNTPPSKKDFKTKLDYEKARLSNLTDSMIHNSPPKSLEVVSNTELSKGKNYTFEILTFDKNENIFWVYRDNGKPEVFWNDGEFRELEYMSFGFGKHKFQLSIKNTGIFGINFNETYSFVISYEEKGIGFLQQ